MTPVDQRLESERIFHNRRFSRERDPRAHLGKFYVAVRQGAERQRERVLRDGRDAVVLEYGCADGKLAIEEMRVPQVAREFHGIDISDAAVERARARAESLGIRNARFHAMNAEALEFPDATFDVVYGRGIIHHLDLDRSYAEVARVLRPGGVALFMEPLGHNPLLNLYRRRTPDLRTPDEHPLLMDDIALAARHFSRVETEHYGLVSLLAVPFRRTALLPLVARASGGMDRLLFRVPALRRNAWYVLLCLTR